MAGRKHGLSVPESVLTFMQGEGSYALAERPYTPDEELGVTVLRHLVALPSRANGSVWVTGLTPAELDEIVRAVGRLIDSATLDPGELRSARTVVTHAERLKETAPAESDIIPSVASETSPESVQVSPLVELLRLANLSVSEASDAHARANELRAQIHKQRDAEIVATAAAEPSLTNERLGRMFGIDGSQVSRIKAAATRRKD